MKTDCVSCFRSLGVKSRMKIYMFLAKEKAENVRNITNFVGLRQPTVSYHLTAMVNCGLLVKQSVGKEVFYSIKNSCPHDSEACCIERPNYAKN